MEMGSPPFQCEDTNTVSECSGSVEGEHTEHWRAGLLRRNNKTNKEQYFISSSIAAEDSGR